MALLDAAGEAADTPVGLDQRARAAYGAGDFEVAIDSWDRQYVLLRDSGDRAGAAQAAATVAMFLMIDTGLMAPVRVWVNRAGLLLDGMEDNPVQATLAAVHGYERFMCGDLDGARPAAAAAIELGERLGNPAAVVIGRTAAARVTILAGDLADGLAQLEHVGTLLLSGEVDDLTTGMMLCELVCAAQGLALHEMAAEWTDAMERWGPGGAFGGLHGRCRVHRAEILRVSGPCDAAEAEALGACDDLRPWMRREFGWPLAELGTIRLRKGDLDGAEEAFVAAHEHVWCPHPGLALVQLERGDLEAARALIDEAIEHPFRNPSKERPPFGDLGLAPLLEAQVEIAVAAGDAPAARAATDRLGTIAERYRSPWLAASRALAAARTALAENTPADAIEAANEAIAGWAEIGAPYETAIARLVLADAFHRAGNEAAATLERQAAASTFDAYGSPGRAAAARAVPTAGPAPAPEPEPSRAVFARDGDIRLVTFAGHTTRVRDLKGLRYIARMLADPGREFHVLDLVAVEQGTLPTGSPEVVGNVEIDGLDAGSGSPRSTNRPATRTAGVSSRSRTTSPRPTATTTPHAPNSPNATASTSSPNCREPSGWAGGCEPSAATPSGPGPPSPVPSSTPSTDWPSTTPRSSTTSRTASTPARTARTDPTPPRRSPGRTETGPRSTASTRGCGLDAMRGSSPKMHWADATRGSSPKVRGRVPQVPVRRAYGLPPDRINEAVETPRDRLTAITRMTPMLSRTGAEVSCVVKAVE